MRYDLYVVTDRALANGLAHAEIARRAVMGGANVIQLRDKHLSPRELYLTALEVRLVTRENNAAFIVNDELDVALAAKADGVHLGQDDLPIEAARRIVPDDFIIGISVSSAVQALKAQEGGADYVALSPVFDTASKNDAGAGRGLEALKEIRKAVTIPVIAIGGVDKKNVPSIIEAGADGVAVISAVVGQKDIEVAARELKAIITKAKGRR
ncbi:MAG: thiamine phosphate synthase [Euryarchaeota archaeon]|nr:thiamine phosphate synthase [Euryarchaeota archaeon]